VPARNATAADRLAALTAASGPDREDLILSALEDEVPSVRDHAVRLAARYVEPRVLGLLVADGVNAARRNGALAALERQGPYAVPYLLGAIKSSDPELVMFALQVLARIGDGASTAGILPLVAHPDPNVAQAAIEALGRLRNAEAVPALIDLLRGNLWLQLAAVTALGDIGDDDAVGPLLALVPDSFVAEQAVRALERIAAPASLGPLLDLLARVTERPLRDTILEAAGVVLDYHPDPGPPGLELGRELESEGAGEGLETFLAELMRLAEAEAECAREQGGMVAGKEEPGGHAALAYAATAVALALRLRGVYPLILRRVGDPDAPWAEPLWRRHARLSGEEMAALLAHGDPSVRRGILAAGRFEPADLPAVLGRLEDEDTDVRAAACRALGKLGDRRAVPPLIERLWCGSPAELSEAAAALGRLPPEELEGLRPCLDPEAPVSTLVAALEAVRAARVAALESEVLVLARAADARLRLAALRAAAALPGNRAEVALFRALGDRDETVQLEVLELLVDRGGARVATTLVALLSAADSVRFRVIRALGRLRVADAAAKLEALYSDAALHERVEIVRALAAIGAPGALEFLEVRLRASEAEVRRVAASGLADIAGRDELAILVAMADDNDWAIRNEAARGLGRLGAVARDTLLTLARDIEPVVARTARLALANFAGGHGVIAA
jgi:HEAT repeat protein